MKLSSICFSFFDLLLSKCCKNKIKNISKFAQSIKHPFLCIFTVLSLHLCMRSSSVLCSDDKATLAILCNIFTQFCAPSIGNGSDGMKHQVKLEERFSVFIFFASHTCDFFQNGISKSGGTSHLWHYGTHWMNAGPFPHLRVISAVLPSLS